MASSSSRLIDAITEYLQVPETNADVVAAFLAGGNKKRLEKELVSEGSTPAAAEAQVRRWGLGMGRQQRNPGNIRQPTREKLVRIIWQRRTPATIHVSGEIYFSNKKHGAFDVPPEDIPTLSRLLAMLRLAKAIEDAKKAEGVSEDRDPEEEVENVLTGMYMGEPSIEIKVAGEVVAKLPYDDEIEYRDCTFTVDKLQTGARRRKSA